MKEQIKVNRQRAAANIRERNLREFMVTIVVDPQEQDDPDLRYQLARAKHNGERIGLVVDGFTYDVGLTLVQLGSVEIEAPHCEYCSGPVDVEINGTKCCVDHINDGMAQVATAIRAAKTLNRRHD